MSSDPKNPDETDEASDDMVDSADELETSEPSTETSDSPSETPDAPDSDAPPDADADDGSSVADESVVEGDGEEEKDADSNEAAAGTEPESVEAREEEDESDVDEESDDVSKLPAFTDLKRQGEEWLAGLFRRMNLDAEAEIRYEDDRPLVDIGGPDAERLLGLGKLGPKAIEGIETLLQSVFSEDDDAGNTYVDVGGKRAARKNMLQRVAVSMADKAVELGEPLTVSGLNSTERRIIHRKLRDYDGVDTESVGDGIFRRLTIDPG